MVNRVFAEADVRVLLGDVNYHYYAGYGGGRKSVLASSLWSRNDPTQPLHAH